MGELRTIYKRGELRTILELSTMDEPALPENIKISWNEVNKEEVKKAEDLFKRYINEGWIAFRVTPDNKRVQIFTFNPSIEKIILVPPLGGG